MWHTRLKLTPAGEDAGGKSLKGITGKKVLNALIRIRIRIVVVIIIIIIIKRPNNNNNNINNNGNL